jgi:hypothetical protein
MNRVVKANASIPSPNETIVELATTHVLPVNCVAVEYVQNVLGLLLHVQVLKQMKNFAEFAITHVQMMIFAAEGHAFPWIIQTVGNVEVFVILCMILDLVHSTSQRVLSRHVIY